MSYLGKAYGCRKKDIKKTYHKNAGRHRFRANYIDWSSFRFCCIAIIFCAVWGGLWIRAGYIQLWEGNSLAEKARRQYVSLEIVSIPRITITDRNGQVLAKSVECYSVYADPLQVEDSSRAVTLLAEYLGESQEKYRKLLSKSGRFVWLKRHIDDATAMAIRHAKIPGIMLVKEYERVYPYKQVAGQLLGFVGVDGIGLEGIERTFNEYLSTVETKQFVQKDASGRKFYIKGMDSEEMQGADLQLTIDTQVQSIAEDSVAQMVDTVEAKWGGVLIADVKTGEVLAWAQYPFFNPNTYRQHKPIDYRNRLALDAFEPGSTFKLFLVAAALEEGVITKDTIFDCENGLWKIKSAVIRDDGIPQKELTVSEILRYSSNIGCGKISLELGAQRFHQYLVKLGFGQPVGLDIAEGRGILRRPRDWSETDLISTGFGQSISTTTAQLAQGFLTIANHGIYKPIKIVMNKDLFQKESKETQIFSKKISSNLLEMMCNVVSLGTGKRAKISGVSIAGKTGTSQKADKTGKYGQERIASFVGIFPAEEPQYLVLVVIDEPNTKRYGGLIAAPVFRNVATKMMAYYGSLPDPNGFVAHVDKKQLHYKREAAILALTRDTQEAVKEVPIKTEVRKKIVSQKPREIYIDADIPDVTGKTIRKAMEIFVRKGLVPEVKGQGTIVVKQEPEPGTTITDQKSGQKYILWLSEK